jgi:hypothetical protein
MAYQPLGKAISRLHMLVLLKAENMCCWTTQDVVLRSDRVAANREFERRPGGTRWSSGVQRAAAWAKKKHRRS